MCFDDKKETIRKKNVHFNPLYVRAFLFVKKRINNNKKNLMTEQEGEHKKGVVNSGVRK